MKGIILAGGSGTRLYPITKGVSKHLLPIYDKPMIYYSLSTLMLAGINDILVISTPYDLPNYMKLLGQGDHLGISINYAEQPMPNGIAEAFIIGEDFIGGDSVCLILGDNIFYGHDFDILLKNASNKKSGATIFGYQVTNPHRFGVIEFNKQGIPINIHEKPEFPKSDYAVTGLYFYDNNVINIAKNLKPSSRGELEITDINNSYLMNNGLDVSLINNDCFWFDAGTHDSLLEVGNFIKKKESTEGKKIACLEEIAYANRWISLEELNTHGEKMKSTVYGKHILKLIDENI
jgi:glucose-1-phosphate thymidylyltransferase